MHTFFTVKTSKQHIFYSDKQSMKKNETKNIGTKKKSKKNNNVLFGIACIILGLLVILVFFLVNKDQIFTNLKETDFFGRVFGTTPQIIENHESMQKNETEVIPLKNDLVTITIETEEEPKTENFTESAVEVEQNSGSIQKSEKNENKTEQNKSEVKKESEVGKKTKEEVVQKPAVANYDIQLCFLVIDGDGLVHKKIVKRTVPKNDSPLTNAINLLLKGPDITKNAEKDCMTVIPKDTKLLSAKVQDKVAYLNFNDALEFNEIGEAGRKTSLGQIVFTATSFSTVNSVQFLIDGKKQNYLGSEGLWIGSPLSREDFIPFL